jgi:hypothetical protein
VAPPEGPPATQQDQDGRGARWVWPLVTALLAVVSIVAVVLYVGARSDQEDLEDDLAATQQQVADLEAELATATSEAAASAEQVGELEAELAAAEAEVERAVAETQEQLASTQAELADAQAAIAEFEARADELGAATSEALGLILSDGSGMDGASAQCVADVLVEERGAAALTDLLKLGYENSSEPQGTPDAATAEIGLLLLEAGDQCGVDVGQFGSESASYGDDPALDALYDGCRDGDGAACDQLYTQSPRGSEYETFAYTCGDRFTVEDSPNFCEGNMPA